MPDRLDFHLMIIFGVVVLLVGGGRGARVIAEKVTIISLCHRLRVSSRHRWRANGLVLVVGSEGGGGGVEVVT